MTTANVRCCAGFRQDAGKTVKLSLDKIQRTGVRTESVQERLCQCVRSAL